MAIAADRDPAAESLVAAIAADRDPAAESLVAAIAADRDRASGPPAVGQPGRIAHAPRTAGDAVNRPATSTSVRVSVSVDATLTHSSAACAPSPPGPNRTVGMPGGGDERRVGPVAHAAGRRRRHPATAARTRRDELRVRVELERLAHQQGAARDVELGVGRAAAVEQRVELGLDVGRRSRPGSVRRSSRSTQRAG